MFEPITNLAGGRSLLAELDNGLGTVGQKVTFYIEHFGGIYQGRHSRGRQM